MCEESSDCAADAITDKYQARKVCRLRDVEMFPPYLQNKLLEILNGGHSIVTMTWRRVFVRGIAVRVALSVSIVAE